jgi:ABC-2 type transport system permease protein
MVNTAGVPRVAATAPNTLLMAGTLRAEATLAAVNLVYILLLGLGGVVFPLTKFPAAARTFQWD